MAGRAPHAADGISRLSGHRAEVRTPTYLAILGEAYTRSARFEDARKVLDEGLTVAAKNDDRCHEAELYRLQGELVLASVARTG